ncbi:MAG: DegT/DnrJ/EryC1/StrS family aminotransferase, partial [Candidatus Kapabacteria bacterium]|nr:DegT/DnrJ/EryC1/StrS family aminotransferase [Candidatus Kapabacteria bacterium]
MLGLNYRFGQMEGAVGLAQLETLPMLNANRKRTCKMISDAINQLDGILPLKIPEGSECLYWIYPVIFDMNKFNTDIKTLGDAIKAEGITGCSHIPYYLITDGYEPMINQTGLYGNTACVF